MSWFSRFKNINVRREEAERNAIAHLSHAWKAFLREHEAASKEYVEVRRMWNENTEKGKQVHSLLGLEQHEEGLIEHADSYDHSADQALRQQKGIVERRKQNTNKLYALITDENHHLSNANNLIQESDHLSKTEILQRIQRINALIPRVADLNLDYATHADNYNQAQSDIAHLEELLKRKEAMSMQRAQSINHIEQLRQEELRIEQEDKQLLDDEDNKAERIKKFERKEARKENEIEHQEKDAKSELHEFDELKAA